MTDAEREEALDNRVVKIAADPLALRGRLELVELKPRLPERDRDDGRAGEDLDKHDVALAEAGRTAGTGDHEGAEHPLLGAERARFLAERR